MKNILYASFLNEDIRPGYQKKIHGQTKAFKNLGNNSYLLIVGNDNTLKLYDFSNDIISPQIIKSNKKRHKQERNALDELKLFNFFVDNAKKIIINKKIDVIYIRRIVPITPKLLSFLKWARKNKVKIIYEYPTFPWEGEVKSKKNKSARDYLFYYLDKILFRSLEKLVDIIAYIGVYEGTDKKYVKIDNGGDITQFPAHIIEKKEEIRLIGVAHVTWYHGFDIIIKALKDYYGGGATRKVFFDIVGSVEPSLNLEKMVHDYKLEDYVIFHGMKTGEDLDNLFNSADIGVNSLNLSFSDFEKTGVLTLKTVEYTMRGIPQISSGKIPDINGKLVKPNFFYVVDTKNNSINILDVVNFYDELVENSEDIRKFALENLSWDKILEKVINKI